MMDPLGRSFNELPLMVTRGKSSILNTVTREVCQDCNQDGDLTAAPDVGTCSQHPNGQWHPGLYALILSVVDRA
jgi:hypothetical protein